LSRSNQNRAHIYYLFIDDGDGDGAFACVYGGFDFNKFSFSSFIFYLTSLEMALLFEILFLSSIAY